MLFCLVYVAKKRRLQLEMLPHGIMSRKLSTPVPPGHRIAVESGG
jgi:hypothetical protein